MTDQAQQAAVIGPIGNMVRMEDFGDEKKADFDRNQRQVAVFGPVFRNTLWIKDHDSRCPSSGHMRVLQSPLSVANDIRISSTTTMSSHWRRGLAINQETGWLAFIALHDLSAEWHTTLRIMVFEPQSSTFALKAMSEPLDLPLDEDIEHGRIRFVGDCIYVFSPARFTVSIYKFDAQTNTVAFSRRVHDPYWTEALPVDMVVTADGKELIFVFNRWLGVYRLKPRFDWYHAIAFARDKNLRPRTLEMSVFDDEESSLFLRRSAKNFAFVSVNTRLGDDQILAIHPSHTSFDYICAARLCDTPFAYFGVAMPRNCRPSVGRTFCISKHYGLFYVRDSVIYQSPHVDHEQCRKFLPMRATNYAHESAPQINHLLYDESYGISGRLMVFLDSSHCGDDDSNLPMHQFVNFEEMPQMLHLNSSNPLDCRSWCVPDAVWR